MKSDDLYRLIWLSRPLMQRVETLVIQGLEGTGLSVRMRAVLEILDKHGDQSVPDLARLLEIKRQYVQQMINDVVAAGYAHKRPNSRHKSSQLISLSELGQTTINAVLGREQQLLACVSETFDAGELSVALKVIKQLMPALDEQLNKEAK